MDTRQLILLICAVGVPVLLLVTRRSKWLLGWICLTLSIHIFDTTVVTNLAAARVAGLIYLPFAIARLGRWLKLTPVIATLVNFGYLLVLALYFGVIFPWPDTTFERAFTLTAPGRAIVFPIRLAAELSITLFVAEQLLRPGNIRYAVRMLIIGSTISAAFAALTLVSPGFDAYFSITGLRALGEVGLLRARGLSFEPRGLGMACAFGIIFLLVYPGRHGWRRSVLMLINLVGLLVSISASAIALLLVGIAAAFLVPSSQAVRVRIVGLTCAAIVLVIAVAALFPDRVTAGIDTLGYRLSDARTQGVVPINLAEGIAFRLDSFDASTLLFFASNPTHAVFGAGPGMVMLPATSYVPPGVFTFLYAQRGLDGLPTLGVLFEMANGGFISLALWFLQVASCSYALWVCARVIGGDWTVARTVFLVGVAAYLVQVSPTSPVWSLFLGIGWAASMQAARFLALQRQSRQALAQPNVQAVGVPDRVHALR